MDLSIGVDKITILIIKFCFFAQFSNEVSNIPDYFHPNIFHNLKKKL